MNARATGSGTDMLIMGNSPSRYRTVWKQGWWRTAMKRYAPLVKDVGES